MRMPDCPWYYSKGPVPRVQYEVLVSLLVLTPLVLSYYSGLVVRGFVDDKSGVWTIAWIEYIFMAGTMLVANARVLSTLCYETRNPQCNRLSGGCLFRLSKKILDALKYSGLYWFALPMSTYSARTVLAIHRSFEVD